LDVALGVSIRKPLAGILERRAFELEYRAQTSFAARRLPAARRAFLLYEPVKPPRQRSPHFARVGSAIQKAEARSFHTPLAQQALVVLFVE
jgi:hypothetical protein